MEKSPHHPFYANGFLVVGEVPHYRQPHYAGVDKMYWPLQEIGDFTVDEATLGIHETMRNAVLVATNWDATHKYWARCKLQNLPVKLLLVETALNYPVLKQVPDEDWVFLGYDIAGLTGDFYSVVRQEIVGGSAKQLNHWKNDLNENGLFPDLDKAEKFLQERSKLVGIDLGIEPCGKFITARLSYLE